MTFLRYKYNNEIDKEFTTTVRLRVNEFFTKHNLSKNANSYMVWKSVAMCLIYFLPLIAMLTGLITNVWVLFFLWGIMGIGTAGIGTGIMHDAIHGSYSNSKNVNKFLSLSMNIIGGNAYVWHMQHDVLHHTYPNIDDADDDIDIPFVLRMSPHQKQRWFHRYQHVYVWILYAFATMYWVTSKDFVQLNKYRRRGLLKDDKEYVNRLINIIKWKIIYYAYLLVLPIILIPVSAGMIVLMFITMHLIAGVLLSIIFQPAHVFLGSSFIQQDFAKIDKSWASYQLETTTNFKLKGFFRWMAGGLNYQIEHHLFPNICHVHYHRISKIVEDTAKEHNLPYHRQGSLVKALSLHGKMLRTLGNESVEKRDADPVLAGT